MMKELRSRIEKELKDGILDYWSNVVFDKNENYYYGLVTNENVVNPEADKGLIQNARNLWSYARAYNYLKDQQYLDMAILTKDILLKYFYDRINRGFYWTIDKNNEPLNRRKQVYGHAFVIYAFSELYRATGNIEDLEVAKETFGLLEAYSFDNINYGYFEAFSETWTEIDDIRLSPIDMNEKKSNNTHLHILEAYTTLLEVWPSEVVRTQLKSIIDVMLNKIMDKKTFNFGLFFDDNWNKKSDIISYGHEIEAAWLIYEALDSINDEEIKSKNLKYVTGIIENCYQNYLDGKSGEMGMFNEDDGQGKLDKDKIWWVQAEACVGFYLGYQLTGEKKYLEVVKNIWNFIENYIVDKENGEWFWYGTDSGTISNNLYKVMNWKSLYHNSRACIELLERSK